MGLRFGRNIFSSFKFKTMKTTNSNKVNMINTTIGFCDANAAATAGITGFAAVLTVIKGKVVLINQLNQIGDGTTTGVTLDTNAIKKQMIVLALKCANATLAYANSTNNNTLAALVDYSETDLKDLKKEDVDDVCEAIHDATNANLAGATPFGVTATDVTDLQTAIDLYRTASQNPRQALISKSQAKKQADALIKDVIGNLMDGQLDKMANTLKSTNVDFWNGYKQAREIIDLGSTPARVRGTVLDENDVPLQGVLFEIFETGTANKVAETTTDVKGKFSATKLPMGDFDFSWELDGYATVKEENVHISPGKDLRRKIVMDKVFVIEGDVQMGMIQNIQAMEVDVEPTAEMTLEVTGSTLRFYASSNPGNAPMGAFFDVQAGQTITKTVLEFATLIGAGGANTFVNVQNIGMMMGHYKITIKM